MITHNTHVIGEHVRNDFLLAIRELAAASERKRKKGKETEKEGNRSEHALISDFDYTERDDTDKIRVCARRLSAL